MKMLLVNEGSVKDLIQSFCVKLLQHIKELLIAVGF